MMDNVIQKATIGYIEENYENLEMALAVEQAMPTIRAKLINDFLNLVEKKIKKKLSEDNLWTVERTEYSKILINHAFFCVRKKYWSEKYRNWPQGVAIFSNGPNWSNVYITVACYPTESGGHLRKPRDLQALA